MDLRNALEWVGLSDVGRQRTRNEDALAADLTTGLVMLADGMGGYLAGDIASEIAVLSIVADIAESAHGQNRGTFSPRENMVSAIQQANAVIHRLSTQTDRYASMGATLVAGLFVDNRLIVGHMGDSRLYRLRQQTLTQLTQDHSYVQEQVNAGELTAEEARWSPHRHLVTRALGVDAIAELELHEHPVEKGDVYLFCSDGLTDLVSDADIGSILLQSEQSLDQKAYTLVHMANALGGTDNISVILVRVKKRFASKLNSEGKPRKEA